MLHNTTHVNTLQNTRRTITLQNATRVSTLQNTRRVITLQNTTRVITLQNTTRVIMQIILCMVYAAENYIYGEKNYAHVASRRRKIFLRYIIARRRRKFFLSIKTRTNDYYFVGYNKNFQITKLFQQFTKSEAHKPPPKKIWTQRWKGGGVYKV